MEINELTPFRRMYERYQLTPSIVFGKSLITKQFTVTSTPVRIIEPTVAKFYSIAVIDPAGVVLIGNKSTTVQSGFAIAPQTSPFTFAITENAELWAVSSGSVTLFLVDFGL